MGKTFQDFAWTGLQKARQMGADSAELFVVKSRSLEVEIKDGSLDEIKQSDSQGVGLRILKGSRQGFSFSSDFRNSALDKMVVQAIANSHYSDEEPARYFPGKSAHYPQLALYDNTLGNYTLDEKLELAQETARAGRAVERTG